MNRGKEWQPGVNTTPSTDDHCFRFRTGKGRLLSDEVASIEELATQSLQSGVSYPSVQTGALELLKLAVDSVVVEKGNSPKRPPRIQACTPDIEPPRLATPEGKPMTTRLSRKARCYQ